MKVDSQKLQLAMDSGVFDAETGAACLNCPSVEVFRVRRPADGMKGVRFGRVWRYSREWLEALVLEPGGSAAVGQTTGGCERVRRGRRGESVNSNQHHE